MELRLYFDILKRRALVILVVTVMTVAVVATWGMLSTPVYTARATVRVLLDVGVADFRLWEDYNRRLLNTYTKILKSRPILEEAIDRLPSRPASLTPGEVWRMTTVEVVPNTELITIAVQEEDPVLARDLANILASLLIEYAQNLYVGSGKSAREIMEDQLADMEEDIASDRRQLEALLSQGGTGVETEALTRQIASKEDAYNRLLNRYELARLNESLRANSITVITPATTPQTPTNGLGVKHIGLALVAGLFGGIGLALVLENLDTRIHSLQQLERLTNLPVLGSAPRGLLSLTGAEHDDETGPSQPIEEAYRLLGIHLQALRGEAPVKTLLITSAVPKEGKSLVAVNLAQVLAEWGQTVFLVDSDLRRPSIAGMLEIESKGGPDGDQGLSTLLTQRPTLDGGVLGQVMRPASPASLFVIVGGPHVDNPTALLASPFMEEILDYLGAQGQTILLDGPPVLGVADVAILAPRVDGVILVVRQAHSKREQVLAALKQLQISQARILGAVFLQKSDKDWYYE